MSKKSNTKAKSRRANNEGTLYQRNDGRWCAQVTVGYKKDGKPDRKTIYGKEQQEVLLKLKQMSLNVLTDGYSDRPQYSDATFMEAYMDWLLTFKKPTVTGRTFECYIFRAKNHISKVGKDTKVQKVGAIDIQRILNNLDENNFSMDVIRKTRNDFNQFFKYAAKEGIVKENPMELVKIAKKRRKAHVEDEYFAIPAELRPKIIAALENDPYLKPMVLTMMYAGLRTAEMLALRWKHIDFKKSTIFVEEALSKNALFDEEGNILGRETYISDTKTDCSVRKFEIGQFLLGVLKEWCHFQEAREKETGIKLTDQNCMVFPTRDGRCRKYSGFRSMLDRFHDKYGFSGIHAHTYRHTFATMLLEQNVNPKIVQKLMGHRDIKTTLGIYSWVSKQVISDSICVIDPAIERNDSLSPQADKADSPYQERLIHSGANIGVTTNNMVPAQV